MVDPPSRTGERWSSPAEAHGRGGRAVGPDAGALRAAVARHRPADDREVASRARILSELARLAHPFDAAADRTHVTASGIVVGAPGVVLHRHRRLGRWMQPGGHVDPGEAPEDAVVRECVEETGLPVAHPDDGPLLVHVDVHEAASAHVHLDLRFLLLAPGVPPAPGPGESPDVAWFSWEDALAMADDALVGALRAARHAVAGGHEETT